VQVRAGPGRLGARADSKRLRRVLETLAVSALEKRGSLGPLSIPWREYIPNILALGTPACKVPGCRPVVPGRRRR
jgi:hypothetical protein